MAKKYIKSFRNNPEQETATSERKETRGRKKGTLNAKTKKTAQGTPLNTFINKQTEIAETLDRPKHIISSILNDLEKTGFERLTKSNLLKLYEYMLTLDTASLTALSDNKNSPIVIVKAAEALLGPSGFNVVQTMLERAYGKAKETVEVQQVKEEIIKIGDREFRFRND